MNRNKVLNKFETSLIKSFNFNRNNLYLYPIKMSKRGGKRVGAGRKSLPDKKKALTIYPLGSQIDACGGLEASKEVALSAIILKSNENGN